MRVLAGFTLSDELLFRGFFSVDTPVSVIEYRFFSLPGASVLAASPFASSLSST